MQFFSFSRLISGMTNRSPQKGNPNNKTKAPLARRLTLESLEARELLPVAPYQYAEIEGATEDLKRSDQMEYTRRMNSIRNRVEEFVLHDFVYA